MIVAKRLQRVNEKSERRLNNYILIGVSHENGLLQVSRL